MKSEKRHIGWWLSGIMMLLVLLTACGSSSTEDAPQTPQPDKPKEKPVLKIYLFAPESPIVTRASTGSVDASQAEKAIHTIDIWVFEHESPNEKVSYIHLDDVSFSGQKEIAMELTAQFANKPKKPNVDIYVAANKESCGLTGLNENTTLAELKETCIGSSSFGTASPVNTVHPEGLPMSGLLENQIISGIPPVYTAMSQNVKLVRAVSKVRFIFSMSNANSPTISNLSISLKDNMIPKEEYLFLEGVYPTYKSRVKLTGVDVYESEASLVTNNNTAIKKCDDPASYAYTSETGQAYENKMNEGITANDLSDFGTFYLRESDKQLEGTISYTLGTAPNATNKSKTFSMAAAGDFTRNHTWIVYGYFLGSGDLKLNVVDVKDWTSGSEDPKVYNW